MKIKKSHISNIVTILLIIVLILPQTRKPIQVALNRVVAMFRSVDTEANKEELDSYEWQLLDKNGKEVDFESMKGKVVLVNLWATWCPPCIAELPSMEKLYGDYGDKVEFFFVSEEEQLVTEKFLNGRKIDVPSYKPITIHPVKLFSQSIPATYIIGKDGMIHVSKVGAVNWNSQEVRNLLDQLISE